MVWLFLVKFDLTLYSVWLLSCQAIQISKSFKFLLRAKKYDTDGQKKCTSVTQIITASKIILNKLNF